MANDKRERAWNDSKNEWIASLPNASLVTAKESGCFNDGWFRGYAAATAEGIPQADGWVAIASGGFDEMPPEYQKVWITYAQSKVGKAHWNGDKWLWSEVFDADGYSVPVPHTVIAWMPYAEPAPYQRPSREGE